MESDDKKTQLTSSLEAVLFKINEPTSLKKLASILDKKEGEILEALSALKVTLAGRGIDLLEGNKEYSLVTSKEHAGIIEKMAKDDLSRDLGKASLETLSIILYKGPVSRREIDYIRGVNSTFILRSLMVRGLVERIESGRSPQYRATSSLLSFLGLSKIDELPEYKSVQKEINSAYKDIEESNG